MCAPVFILIQVDVQNGQQRLRILVYAEPSFFASAQARTAHMVLIPKQIEFSVRH
jgi:hypothetical protein